MEPRHEPPTLATRARALGGRLLAAVEGPEHVPLAWTLRRYAPEHISGDVIAGLTVAALIVPLSIGYASVAGLPPEMGLYASVAPLLAYAVFGSARRLVVGPDAASAAMIAATIAPLAVSSDERARLAGVLGLLVAAVFVVMRLLRMGFMADLLSRPILVGYLAGVGITVVVGQVEKIIGGPAFQDVLALLRRIDWVTMDPGAVLAAVQATIVRSGADWISAALGLGVIAAILVGRRVRPGLPMALIALLVSLVLSWALDLQAKGVQVLGPVPGGFPPIGIPSASPTELVALLPGAIGLALLTFADTTATGRSFAARNRERTDPDRELVALAAADAAGALSGGYPVSSSPSRTAAAENAGSHTQLAGVVAAAAVLVVLLVLTAPLAYLPTPALGAVILTAVLGLVDVPQLRAIWRAKRSEGLIALIALGGVVAYGTLAGVMVAVLLAALNVVRRAASPPILEEGRLPDGSWRTLARRGDTRRVEGVTVMRFAGPLFFANATALAAAIRDRVAERPSTTAVIVDMGAVSDVDLTAADTLAQLRRELEDGGRRLAVARPMGHVRDALRTLGVEDLMAPTTARHRSIDDAIRGLGLDPERMLAREPGQDGRGGEPTGVVARLTAPESRPLVRILGLLTAVVVVAAVVGIAIGSTTRRDDDGPVAVPNLIGMPLNRAISAATDAGFELSAPIYVPRDDQPEGTVVSQEPAAGTLADPGSAIQPYVSTKRALVTVPNVVGTSEADAIVALTGVGLGVRRTLTEYNDLLPAGTVISTAPPAGAEVAAGTTVAYTVSRGPEPVPTPSGPAVTTAPSAGPSPTPPPVSTTPPDGSAAPSSATPPPASDAPTQDPGPADTPEPSAPDPDAGASVEPAASP